MFKRIRWLTAGLTLGFGASFWFRRKAREAADRYRPAGLALATAARARDALVEGRTAMREREAELRGRGPG